MNAMRAGFVMSLVAGLGFAACSSSSGSNSSSTASTADSGTNGNDSGSGGDAAVGPGSCVLTLTGALTMQLPCVSSGVSATGSDLIEVKSASGTIGAPGTLFDFNCAPPHPLSVGAVPSRTCGVEVVDTFDDGGNIEWALEPGGSVAGDEIDMTATSVTPIDDNTMYAVSGHGGFTLLGTNGSTLVGSVVF